MMTVLVLCCLGMSDVQKLEEVKDTALSRLKTGATQYVKMMDGNYEKWKKTFKEKIEQKIIDYKLSEDAVITQYITDYVFKISSKLKDGPKGQDFKLVLDIARHLALMAEKDYIYADWRKYEKEITIWGDWYLQVSKKK